MCLKPKLGSPLILTMLLSPNRGVTSPMNHGKVEDGTGQASTSMEFAGISSPSPDPTRIVPVADRMVGTDPNAADPAARAA
jgi:hypothetical protein